MLRKDDPVSGEWIGELGMSRWKFDEVVDLEERKRLFEGNFKLAAGDERVVWSVGCEFDRVVRSCALRKVTNRSSMHRPPSSRLPWERYHDSCSRGIDQQVHCTSSQRARDSNGSVGRELGVEKDDGEEWVRTYRRNQFEEA